MPLGRRAQGDPRQPNRVHLVETAWRNDKPQDSAISMVSMRKISVGTESSPDAEALTGVLANTSTVSMPCVTRPKMVNVGCRLTLVPWTMKNWLPLVFGPPLAMAKIPREYARVTGSS